MLGAVAAALAQPSPGWRGSPRAVDDLALPHGRHQVGQEAARRERTARIEDTESRGGRCRCQPAVRPAEGAATRVAPLPPKPSAAGPATHSVRRALSVLARRCLAIASTWARTSSMAAAAAAEPRDEQSSGAAAPRRPCTPSKAGQKSPTELVPRLARRVAMQRQAGVGRPAKEWGYGVERQSPPETGHRRRNKHRPAG